MSKAPLQKNLKQTKIAFQQIPKKETTRHSEPGETSQASDNVQKKQTATDSEPGETSEASDSVQTKMDYSFKKEVEEGPSKHLQQEAEVKIHNFQYCFNTLKRFSVSCETSMDVLAALDTSQMFIKEKDKKKNKQKEILIQRYKEGFPTAAVKTDFPCCLIDTDEILEIDFIQKDKNSSTNQTYTDLSLRKTSKPEMLVTFWVTKGGGQKVQCLLKSKALRSRVQCVCVYAFKGEKIKKALRRDGRFKNAIFQKQCVLSEFSGNLNHELSNPVDKLNGKTLHVVVASDENQPDSQDDFTLVKTEPNAASDADVAETVTETVKSQNPINTEQGKKQGGNTKFTNPSTKQYVVKPIVNSKEILGILRDQFPDLLETLKQREKLESKSEVQKFFRAEYGKSVDNFLQVKKVKQLMKLSDSVCQIRQEGSAIGTGFLLFDRYVLTNAHVIGGPIVNTAQLTAVFGYEDQDSEDSKRIPVKQLIAYFHGKDDKGRHLDYALLELDDVDKIAKYPKLLDCYHPNTPIKGQICIVGHPGEGVKKMDPCFIIERENRLEAAKKHTFENQHLIHLKNEACLERELVFSASENKITYNSCFFEGSSGSPIFDVDCNLIGIHTGGYTYKTGDKTWNIMEYGFFMQPILDNIRAKARIQDLPDIVSVIEAYSNVSGTAEQQNQKDIDMESAEESDEL